MQVELLLDSRVAESRITLFRVTYPRIVHAELLRHRNTSICSSSSRAIPLERMIEQYCIADPPVWRKHQPGMQPDEDYQFSPEIIQVLNKYYSDLRVQSIDTALELHRLGVAKELVNRLLEPYSNITHLMQGTHQTFTDFFELRCTRSAQYEIRELALRMQDAYYTSTPVQRFLHLPFIIEDEFPMLPSGEKDYYQALRISAARCARTSYYNHEGKPSNPEADLELSNNLSIDRHMSPFEFSVMDHDFATRIASEKMRDFMYYRFLKLNLKRKKLDLSGNLRNPNLVQYRKFIEAESMVANL